MKLLQKQGTSRTGPRLHKRLNIFNTELCQLHLYRAIHIKSPTLIPTKKLSLSTYGLGTPNPGPVALMRHDTYNITTS